MEATRAEASSAMEPVAPPGSPGGRARSRRPVAVLVLAGLLVGMLIGVGAVLAVTGDDAGPSRSSAGAPSTGDRDDQTAPWERAGTRYGASFQSQRGESYASALARNDSRLGELDLVRAFYPGEPDPWPGKAPGRDVIVSFKLEPRSVLSGDHDDLMRRWFASAPRDRDIFWVFWHEPEDDIEDGSFSAKEFGAAFARLDGLADEANNPRLISTLILMSWSTRDASGRDWRDYVPPADSFDVFAWDVYNREGSTSGVYASPAELLDAPRRAAESLGKPFAIAELGSVLVDGDDGSERADWLRSIADYLQTHEAVFAAYFNFSWNDGQDDYRLLDKPSLEAWREITA